VPLARGGGPGRGDPDHAERAGARGRASIGQVNLGPDTPARYQAWGQARLNGFQQRVRALFESCRAGDDARVGPWPLDG